MASDMDIFMDMMSDQESPFCETVEKGKDNHYYQGLGIHILKQFETNEHYFHFLKSIITNYSQLSEEQKKEIKELMNIQPEVIIKEKMIVKKQKQTNKKPKLNMSDDY